MRLLVCMVSRSPGVVSLLIHSPHQSFALTTGLYDRISFRPGMRIGTGGNRRHLVVPSLNFRKKKHVSHFGWSGMRSYPGLAGVTEGANSPACVTASHPARQNQPGEVSTYTTSSAGSGSSGSDV